MTCHGERGSKRQAVVHGKVEKMKLKRTGILKQYRMLRTLVPTISEKRNVSKVSGDFFRRIYRLFKIFNLYKLIFSVGGNRGNCSLHRRATKPTDR